MHRAVLSPEVDKRLAEGLDKNSPVSQRRECFVEWQKLRGDLTVLHYVAYLTNLPKDDADVEEIVQQAIYNAYVHTVAEGKFEYQNVPFTAFVKNIAQNLVREEANKRKRRKQISLEALSEQGLEIGVDCEQLTRSESQQELALAIQKVTPVQREILEKEQTGCSSAEIAKEMGMSEAAVRKNRSRAVVYLRNQNH